MGKRILAIDSQILTSYQSCKRKYDLSFRKNIRSKTTEPPLEKGTLLHSVFEIYYSLIGDCISEKSDIFKEVKEAGLEFGGSRADRMAVAQYAIDCGRYIATKQNLDSEEVQTVLYQCGEYFKYYHHDQHHPIAVEQVGSKVIYEDADVKFLYTFKIDLVVEKGNRIIPVDHKTASRRSEPSDMNNQFMGYCFGLGVNTIMVNRIGFQKTLPPNQRFERFQFTYTPARLGEWVENTVHTMFDILDSHDNDLYPFNFTSCDKYSGCAYRVICGSDPAIREVKLERHFQIVNQWDPATMLEETE